MTRPLRIGLTGGIGSGKSTVARLFAARGVPLIDTDRIAREVVEPGQPAHREIVAAFGPEVAGPDGRLRRDVLRARVFADPAARRRLEAITHPRILAAVEARAAALAAPYCIVDVPLLVESGLRPGFDRVLVVDCEESEQIRRVVARDALTAAEVEAIMRTQARRRDRLAAADDVIRNDGDPDALLPHVDRLHTLYLELAANRDRDDSP